MMKWLSVTHLTEACYCHLISASYTQLIPIKQLIPFHSPIYRALTFIGSNLNRSDPMSHMYREGPKGVIYFQDLKFGK